MRIRVQLATWLGLFGIVAAVSSAAQNAEDSSGPHGVSVMKDVMVPARDGVRLATDVYLPTDASGTPLGDPLPTIMTRTPYGKNGGETAGRYYASYGYAFVSQDTRGRYNSEGVWHMLDDDGRDGADAAAWIADQPWSNGDVGMYGGSYVGGTQHAVAMERAPELKTIIPTDAMSNLGHQSMRNGGAFELRFWNWIFSAYNSADRIRIARLYGAHVTPIDLKQHMQKADQLQGVERAAAFVAIRMKQCYDLQQSDASNWWANQLCNVDNTRAHREHTGREILDQMNGPIDGWVASVGTGGTLLGVAQTLKETYPELKVAGVLPTDDPRIEWVRSRAVHKALENFGGPKLRFVMEDLLDSNVMDVEITIENDDAKKMADRLCREEGLYCGMSSGANVCAAIEVAETMKKGSKIVTVIVDRRDRYFAEYPNEHYVV